LTAVLLTHTVQKLKLNCEERFLIIVSLLHRQEDVGIVAVSSWRVSGTLASVKMCIISN